MHPANPKDRAAKPWRSASWGLAFLATLASLAVAAGCGGRRYDEVHATREYHHHLEGTEVTTHAKYY